MTTRIMQRAPRRTLVLALGQRGLAIASAFQRRLAERGRADRHLATVAIVAGDGSAGLMGSKAGGELCIVTVGKEPAAAQGAWASREAMRQAVLGMGPALAAVLVEQLMGISRVQPAQSVWSAPLKLSPELDVVLAAGLDDLLASACLLDVAYLVRYLARQRLNAVAQVTGLLLLPDLESAEDPPLANGRRTGGMACCYAALQELDLVMAPHDGFVSTWGEGLAVEGWGPPFDRGCFLLGALNAQSLALGSPAERNEMAAEILLLLATTDVARLCEAPASAATAWRWGARARGYGGVGLAAWVYPAERLIEHASRRVAMEMLEAWQIPRRDAPQHGAEQAAGFWHSVDAAPAALRGQVLPAATFDHNALWRPLACQVSLTTARRLRQALDEQMAERLESIAAQRPALDQRAQAVGQALVERLAATLGQTLDAPAAGRLPEADAWLAAAKAWLEETQVESRAAGEAAWHTLEGVEREIERTGQQLEARAAACGFPEQDWRAWAGILLRPRRLWGLVQALPELQHLAATYAALLLRQTSTALELLLQDLIGAAYETALEGANRQATRLATLRLAAAAASGLLQPAPPAPCGPLGFSLELSALTPETAEALVRQARGALADLLTDATASSARLSGWPGVDPDGEDMAGVALDFARARCAGALAGLTVDDLLLQGLPDPQARLEALHGLLEAASPFLAWDETQLDGEDQGVMYSCALLGLGEGAAARALSGVGEVLFGQVLATGDDRRVTALCAVQGLPLAAVEGYGEGITTNKNNEWEDGNGGCPATDAALIAQRPDRVESGEDVREIKLFEKRGGDNAAQ